MFPTPIADDPSALTCLVVLLAEDERDASLRLRMTVLADASPSNTRHSAPYSVILSEAKHLSPIHGADDP
jgi:hypothetical protein